MKLRIRTQAQSDAIFRHMAREAGLAPEDLAECVIYAHIAAYAQERGIDDIANFNVASITHPGAVHGGVVADVLDRKVG